MTRHNPRNFPQCNCKDQVPHRRCRYCNGMIAVLQGLGNDTLILDPHTLKVHACPTTTVDQGKLAYR